jgi:hypothetical protein
MGFQIPAGVGLAYEELELPSHDDPYAVGGEPGRRVLRDFLEGLPHA